MAMKTMLPRCLLLGEPGCYRCHSSYQAFTGGVIRDIRPVRKILDSSRRDAAWSWLLQARMARNEEVLCPKHGRENASRWNCRSRYIKPKRAGNTAGSRET